METKGQSSVSSMLMGRPHNMQEELGSFYNHRKGIIWSMLSIYNSRQPIIKLSMKPYFRFGIGQITRGRVNPCLGRFAVSDGLSEWDIRSHKRTNEDVLIKS